MRSFWMVGILVIRSFVEGLLFQRGFPPPTVPSVAASDP